MKLCSARGRNPPEIGRRKTRLRDQDLRKESCVEAYHIGKENGFLVPEGELQGEVVIADKNVLQNDSRNGGRPRPILANGTRSEYKKKPKSGGVPF